MKDIFERHFQDMNITKSDSPLPIMFSIHPERNVPPEEELPLEGTFDVTVK